MGNNVQIISKLNENGEFHYGNCKLVVGDGTEEITFLKGRAIAPVDHAKRLVDANQPYVEIPELDYSPPDPFRRGQLSEAMRKDAEAQDIPPEILELAQLQPDARQALVDLAKGLTSGELVVMRRDELPQTTDAPDAEAPRTDEEPADTGDGPDPDGTAGATAPTDPKLAAAIEHLRQEGMEAPTPLIVPDGFDAMLPDKSPRCLIAKADGGQCKNVAEGNTGACKIPQHQARVAELQAQPVAA